MAHRIKNNNWGVGRGQGIDNVSEGLDIRGRRWKLLRRNDGPEESATTAEALAEEYDPEV